MNAYSSSTDSEIVLPNDALIKQLLKSLYAVAGRRTSSRFADDVIRSSLEILKERYPFLKGVNINQQSSKNDVDDISIEQSMINPVPIEKIGKTTESLVRMVYDELNEEAGLYFITELKEHLGKKISIELSKTGIDLDQIQLEQHYAWERRERKKAIKEGRAEGGQENLLGYTWDKVASWHHEEGSKFCTLYDEKGEVIDRLNLDRIIQNYVETLSGVTTSNPDELQKELRIFEQEYSLLKLMHNQDMDAETAMQLLEVNRDVLNDMIKKLTNMEMIRHVSNDVIEITKEGIEFVSTQEKK
jgi:hypothetical protein